MNLPARVRRVVPLLAVVGVAAAACGLSPASRDAVGRAQGQTITGGTAQQAAGGDAGVTDTGGAAVTTPTTSPTDAGLPATGGSGGLPPVSTGGGGITTPNGTAPNGTTPTTTTGGGTGTRPTTGGSAPTGTKTSAAAAGGPCTTGGGTSTGINASTINIGEHAPLTGTGTPFPNTSFATGSQLFWDAPGHTVCGRKVKVDFRDDQYNPSGARAVCEPMSRQDFLVAGLGGTDQIQSCATDPVLGASHTPYLSAGVTTNGLTGLSNYFAASLTYQQQGALVVRAAKDNKYATPSPATTGKQWAVVTANSKNFDDATQGITSALDAAGISYEVIRVNQSGNYDTDAVSKGQTLALDNYGTVYVDAAPGYFVFMTGGYYKQNPAGRTIWTGPGVTYTEVTVAQLACEGATNLIDGKAYFLAPGPGLDHATADFKAVAGAKYDDIEWSIWGLSEALYKMLTSVGAKGSLTRENFISRVSGATFPGGIYSALDFRSSHFGGTGAWLQKINCSQSEPGQSQPGTWLTVGSAPYVL